MDNDPKRCSARIPICGAGGLHSNQCKNTGAVEEGGKAWCRIHAPSAVAARYASKRANDRGNVEEDNRPLADLRKAEAKLARIGKICDEQDFSGPETLLRNIQAVLAGSQLGADDE